MRALVVYESIYGNTHALADAIAEGFVPGVEVRSVHETGSVPGDVEFLVVGGPTHMHGLSTAMSRKMAVAGSRAPVSAPRRSTPAGTPARRSPVLRPAASGAGCVTAAAT